MSVLEVVVVSIFSCEFALKVISEGFSPLEYFRDPWNTFDFVIVFASILPLTMDIGSVSSLVTVFRLLRLLRVFKLAKQFRELRIIVEALIKGFSSISFISLLLFLLFYVYAIVGTLLFKRNDPRHFGQLHLAMTTLFRVVTLDGWSEIL